MGLGILLLETSVLPFSVEFEVYLWVRLERFERTDLGEAL